MQIDVADWLVCWQNQDVYSSHVRGVEWDPHLLAIAAYEPLLKFLVLQLKIN